jgi:hypothetical protein
MELNSLAVQGDLALVRPVEASKNVRQGGFARAVLAEQCVDLSLRGVEVDVIVRNDCGEPLRDPPQCYRGRERRGSLSFPAFSGVSPWRYRRRP